MSALAGLPPLLDTLCVADTHQLSETQATASVVAKSLGRAVGMTVGKVTLAELEPGWVVEDVRAGLNVQPAAVIRIRPSPPIVIRASLPVRGRQTPITAVRTVGHATRRPALESTM